METITVKIDANLVSDAQKSAEINNRSLNEQIEYWAKIGKIVDSMLNKEDIRSLLEGKVKISVVPI